MSDLQERQLALHEKNAETGAEKSFALVQRKAAALANSNVVPAEYKGNLSNCMVAMEMAERTNSSPLAVMQNMHIIHGRPSFSSAFIIGALAQSKRFSTLNYEMFGDEGGTDRGCYAYATCKETGERLESPKITMAMAKAEGWSTKKGSKWLTMPELMLRYRAAAFFGRLFAPDVMLGMHMSEEVQDIKPSIAPSEAVSDINADLGLSEQPEAVTEALNASNEVIEAEVIDIDEEI